MSHSLTSMHQCRICNSPMSLQWEYELLGACGPCASKLGNAYIVARTGQPDYRLAPEEYAVWCEKRRIENFGKYQKKPVSRALRTQVLERDEYRCKGCNGHKRLCVDHIISERFGGAATLDNLQTLCHSCNSRKGLK